MPISALDSVSAREGGRGQTSDAVVGTFPVLCPSLLAQGSEDGRVHIWDIVEAKTTHLLEHHTRPVCSLSYHPNKPMLLTASYDGSAVLWGP